MELEGTGDLTKIHHRIKEPTGRRCDRNVGEYQCFPYLALAVGVKTHQTQRIK